MIFFLAAAVFSCNQGETLQTYYVDKQEAPNFFSVDVPASLVKLEESDLTNEQKEAYNSINKLNMLAYSIGDDPTEYETELNRVRAILKDEKYEDLARGGNNKDGKFVIKMIGGDDDSIDELIVFGNATDRGFAIIRVLGNNMHPEKIMTLGNVLNKIDSEENAVKDMMQFFQL